MKKRPRFLWLVVPVLASQLLSAESYHLLQPGETLYQLSRRYAISVDELKQLNNISDVTDLAVGMRLQVSREARVEQTASGTGTYTVVKGDTLYGIARNYQISVDDLLKLNGLSSSHVLMVGEKIRIPGAGETNGATAIVEREIQNPTPSQEGAENYWPHRGVRNTLNGKLVGKEILASNGDPVVSVSSGKVIWVAPYHGYGKIIMIESPDKHIFAYGGNSDTLVNVGDFVQPGQKLGLIGTNGRDDLPKVYFFVYKNGKPVDPDIAPRK